MEWLLVLDIYFMEAKTEAEINSQVIEINGFSTAEDCEKAGKAAWEVFSTEKRRPKWLDNRLQAARLVRDCIPKWGCYSYPHPVRRL